MPNPILAAQYDPRVDEVTPLGAMYQASTFPYCCGGTVLTGLERVKDIKLLSAWYTKGGGVLFWTQIKSRIGSDLRKRLLEAGWTSQNFFSRMAGHYEDELWVYVGKKEDIVNPTEYARLIYRDMWPKQKAGLLNNNEYKDTAMSKGPTQRHTGAIMATTDFVT
jgi:hypothetical protein